MHVVHVLRKKQHVTVLTRACAACIHFTHVPPPPPPPPSPRYDHALSKANYASLALRQEDKAAEEEAAGLDEDEDLYASLTK